jgi:hypothetical protein
MIFIGVGTFAGTYKYSQTTKIFTNKRISLDTNKRIIWQGIIERENPKKQEYEDRKKEYHECFSAWVNNKDDKKSCKKRNGQRI